MTDVLELSKEDLEKLSTEELIKLRDLCEYHEEQLNVMQLTKKILINGLYGAITKDVFIVFNMFIAGAITSNGRYFIQTLGRYLEDFLQSKLPKDIPYWVYADTDSTYLQLAPYVEKYSEGKDLSLLDKVKFCDKFTDSVLQKIVDQCIFDFTSDFNAFDHKQCGCKREVIADTMIWCEKKHYYGRERADESGIFPINSPEIKIMGIDLKKSSTSIFAKNHIMNLLDIIFDGSESELRNAISDLKETFYEASIDDIAMIGNCSSIDYNLGDKGVPFGARATLVYNKFIKDNNLEEEFSQILPNEKSKRLYLKTPNRFESNAIAYLDKKFANKYLKSYIDYELMFEKSFLALVKNMVDSMGYNLERLNVLEDW